MQDKPIGEAIGKPKTIEERTKMRNGRISKSTKWYTRLITYVGRMKTVNLLLICLSVVAIVFMLTDSNRSLKSLWNGENGSKGMKHDVEEMFVERDEKFDILIVAIRANAEAIKELNQAVDKLHPLEDNE